MKSATSKARAAIAAIGDNPNWQVHFKGMKADDLRRGFLNNLEYNIAKDKFTLTDHDTFLSLAYTVRERLIERWILTQQQYHATNAKRVYYLSMEFLMGRLLEDNMMNLGIEKECRKAMEDLGLPFDEMIDQEPDAGLGNGGLGRLAACFLDSMAMLKLPAMGYGIRYEFGIFKQKIIKGNQVEVPEEWLQYGDPWGLERPEYKFTVKYYGHTGWAVDTEGHRRKIWADSKDLLAIPYDVPIPGYGVNNVNTLRLWAARSVHEFDFQEFNTGDYIGACQDKLSSENISKVLYPNDNNHSGKELRLKQQHFFTSASLQDILRRHTKENSSFDNFADKVAIQINDTHPAIAIAELMRLFVDEHGMTWDKAWDITTKTFAYTNHTLMPEALERWPVSLFESLLPRHLEIIYEINSNFLRLVSYKYPGDLGRLARMSLIEEGDQKMVRMAYLAIVGSHSVNGVAALHTELLKNGLVRDFYEMWPEKFNNKTNGITQRRWLHKANPGLSGLIEKQLGNGWVKDLTKLKGLDKLAKDKAFHKEWLAVKYENKKRLAAKVDQYYEIKLDPDMLFDVQVKRMHEYKRQLLSVFHGIALYNRIKRGDIKDFVPRAIMFGGKAAPGYYMAKLIIKFINEVANVINYDPATKGLLSMHFLPDYRVTLAEYIVPAADLSEQISTAGTEASGTSNMKFALNGALTIGTLDGANIEICEEVGRENIFIFGLLTSEVNDLRNRGYNPWEYAERSPELKAVMELIGNGFFSPHEPALFKPIYDNLAGGDRYMLLADFDSYIAAQHEVDKAYRDKHRWTEMAIHNVANMAKFSSDRTIQQYTDEIWGVKPVDIKLNR